MSKKSVVEWMINQLEGYEYNRINRKNSWADSIKHLEYIKEKAKQMHKQEIVNAFYSGGSMRYERHYLLKDIDKDGCEYYQETFEGGNNE